MTKKLTPALNDVKMVACTKCGAKPGAKCTGKTPSSRTATHQERWTTFLSRAKKVLEVEPALK
jgi:hypothetical protein